MHTVLPQECTPQPPRRECQLSVEYAYQKEPVMVRENSRFSFAVKSDTGKDTLVNSFSSPSFFAKAAKSARRGAIPRILTTGTFAERSKTNSVNCMPGERAAVTFDNPPSRVRLSRLSKSA